MGPERWMHTWRVIRSVILEQRLEAPGRVAELARKRPRRQGWSRDRLVMVAMDHPGRRVLAAGGDPWAMANRAELLRRTAHVLMQPGVDGLLATPDIMEELLILNDWMVARGGPDFLAGKVLVGSMNRAGLAETVFELDDFVTAYTAEAIADSGLDAGKLLLRLDPNAPESARTLGYCAEAINDLARRGLPVFLEPLSIPQDTDGLVRLVGVATAIGHTSAGRWLKLPMAENFARVAEATTCPILLLGGGRPGSPEALLRRVEACLRTGDNVRGVMIGRGVLYPEDGSDPVDTALALAACVHGTAMQEGIPWPDQLFTRSAG
ncbi:Cgl0159 family (beta/alpha)8-fold protein [Alicyclobacillus macrosporangiidus]|uniref:Cgl0159 family (beta/alpha)8-fold protein n=1 Tax=Alicyclobacillus macrosporangiidus TaxID=392015 RepID=UPI00068C2AD2|nr:hypothetical protein [Alicyclobacillus macrosporangiidus]